LYHLRFLLFISVSLALLGCENSEKEITDLSKKYQQVEEARGVRTLFSQTGTLKAILTAPLMLRYLGDSTVIEFPKTMHVDFYDSVGRVESRLDARFARYIENRSKVLLRDSVQIVNSKGDTLRTPELWWDQAAGMFYTDSTVRITQADRRIRGGKGMVASQDLTNILIKQPTGTVLVGEDVLPQ
jgi:LPS export ABC transporter protein LptC